MEHSKTPWRIEPATKKDNWRIVASNGQVVSTFSGNMDMDNARRIVACVNACSGISTEALEHRAHMLSAEDDTIALLNDHLETERASLFAESQRKQQLEQQVCTLLGALELLLCDVEEAEYMTGREREAEARAVIQKVRGGEC